MQKQEKKEKLINLYLKFLGWKQNKNFFASNYNIKKNNLVYFFNNYNFFFQKNFIKFFFFNNSFTKQPTVTSTKEEFDNFFKKSVFKNNILNLSYSNLSSINKKILSNLRLKNLVTKQKVLSKQIKVKSLNNYLGYVYYVTGKKNLWKYFKQFFFLSKFYVIGESNYKKNLLKLKKKKKLKILKKKNLLLNNTKLKKALILFKKNRLKKKKFKKIINKLNLLKKNLRLNFRFFNDLKKQNAELPRNYFIGYNFKFFKNFTFSSNINTQIFLFDNFNLRQISSKLIFSLQERFNFKLLRVVNDNEKFFLQPNFFDIFLNFKKAMLFRERILKKPSYIRKFNCFFKFSKNNLFFTLTNIFNETIISFSCRTGLDKKKINKRVVNSIYYTLPRFIKKIKLRMHPTNKINNFFLPLNLMAQGRLIKSIFKRNKIFILNVKVKQVIKHNNFLKLKKLSRKKRLS